MMKFTLIALTLSGIVIVSSSLKGTNDQTLRDPGSQLRECLGDSTYLVLVDLSKAFELFLDENGYLDNADDKLAGYKKYLQQVLSMTRPDTGWVFRTRELESLIQRLEGLHIAELLYEDKIGKCVIEISYPDTCFMASYREIMPQHTVPPYKFAKQFIDAMVADQFNDPVVKILIALEYFLGPALAHLRPDPDTSIHGHQH